MLPKENKEEFHENVDHSSIRDKLGSLMEKSEDFIKVMKHEENLRNIFNKNKILGIIANHKELWESLSFLIMSMLNIAILSSYSEYFIDRAHLSSDEIRSERLFNPRLFYIQNMTNTLFIFKILGAMNLAFSGLVVFFFFLKKAPLLIKEIWEEFETETLTRF